MRVGSFRFEAARNIPYPSAAVWRVITDTHVWPRWGPSVSAVECDERYIQAGSKGRVKTRLGPWMSFQVTSFEPGCYWHWRVSGVQATGHRVEALNSEQCRLVFEVPVWAPAYVLICRRALFRIEGLLGTEEQTSKAANQ